MAESREVVGRPPPKYLSKPLMVQILSHVYQQDTIGGYNERLNSQLKSAARRDVLRPDFKPGSQFVREYHGVTKRIYILQHNVSALGLLEALLYSSEPSTSSISPV